MKEMCQMRGLTLINYILALPGIAFALTIHEYFKALVSFRLGDPYPKLHGRLRANPKIHIEPIGFLLMLLYGYGWGLPVNTSRTYYKDKKMGTLITYTAPSLVNLLFAFAFFVLLLSAKEVSYAMGLGLPLNSQGFAQSVQTIAASGYNLLSPGPIISFLTGTLYQIVYLFIRYNLSAAIVNLIPVYPLDGSFLLENFLSGENRCKLGLYKRTLLILLLFLFMSGFINALFDPIIYALLRPIN